MNTRRETCFWPVMRVALFGIGLSIVERQTWWFLISFCLETKISARDAGKAAISRPDFYSIAQIRG
jgi:hypothetical protein